MSRFEDVNNRTVDFKRRKVVPELIDNFKIKGKKLEKTLIELEWVNKYLGGVSGYILPVYKYLLETQSESVKIVDIGCGSGDILKKLYDLGNKLNSKIKLTGLDANKEILNFAKTNHFKNNEVSLLQVDVVQEPEKIDAADIYMFNHFLHHFELGKIQSIFTLIAKYQPSMIVVNDLQRSKIAYYLFKWLCKFKNTSYLTSHDGQLSITKGFNEEEMRLMGNMIPGYSYQLKWNWAFHWQLVLRKEIDQ